MHFAAYTIVPESVAQPLKYYGNNTCSTRTLLRVLPGGRRAPLRVLLHRGRLRHAGGRRGGRDHPDGADQPLRHLQAHVRMDAGERGRRLLRCAMPHCAISTSPARTAAAASARRRPTRRCSSRSPARRRSASARTCRSSAPTTRPPTAPACATTSTSRTWPPRTWMRWRTCAPAATPTTLNVGYGHGYSVRQVLESVERVTGRRLAVREEAPAAGRPAGAGGPRRAHPSELGWRPRLNDLDTIVRTAYAWEQRLQQRALVSGIARRANPIRAA